MAEAIDQAAAMTSMLFVPGSRPDRIGKALASDADIVCVDLEDAVPAADKAEARAAAIAAVGPRVAIRINAVTTAAGLADLLALAEAPVLPVLLFVPKVESTGELAVVRGVLPTARLAPLIETPAGLRHAFAIASAPGVAAVMFGGADLAAELGVALAWEPLLHARQALVMASAEAGVPAIDVPWVTLDDADGLTDQARRAHALGFQAKAAIHPAQLGAIHAAFRPSPALLAEAHAALAAHDAAGGGAIRFNGRMLEAPFVRRYARIAAMGARTSDA